MSVLNAITDYINYANTYNHLKSIFHYCPTKERYDELNQALSELDDAILKSNNINVVQMLEINKNNIKSELSHYQRKIVEETEEGYTITYRNFTEEEFENYDLYLSELVSLQRKFNQKRFGNRKLNFLEEKWKQDADEYILTAESLLESRRG